MTHCSRLLRLALSAALLVLATSARAQFNGPGLSSGVNINQPTTVTSDHALLYPGARDVTLTQGDVIAIHIFGQTDFVPAIRIGTDGKILLPLIGEVSLDHLTVTAAEQLIARKLKDGGFFVDPQVTLQVTEGPNSVITVIGEAHGVIPVTGSRRLLDILAAAGGLPMTASHVITIDRPGAEQPLTVDLGTDPSRSSLANIPVFPGDTIITARVGVVYVIGSFKAVGAIPLAQNTPLTLLELASLAGGPSFDAKLGDLRVIRTTGQTRTVVQIDMKRVLFGKAPDPILQPNDIVFLPSSFLKASIQNGSVNSVLSLSSLAISALSFSSR